MLPISEGPKFALSALTRRCKIVPRDFFRPMGWTYCTWYLSVRKWSDLFGLRFISESFMFNSFISLNQIAKYMINLEDSRLGKWFYWKTFSMKMCNVLPIVFTELSHAFQQFSLPFETEILFLFCHQSERFHV